MKMDGSDRGDIDSMNITKTNLQWIDGHRLVYINPDRKCVFLVDIQNREPQQILCFPANNLDGFRVSPDGRRVAISINNLLTVVPFDLEKFKTINSFDLLVKMDQNCFFINPPIRDVRWSNDGTRVAALVRDSAGADKIQLLEIDASNCRGGTLFPIDEFPKGSDYSDTSIPDFDWDGDHRFLLNDIVRNRTFGNLYLYDSDTKNWEKINPIGGKCCYRDARWSPDGKYILFLYQNQYESEIKMYYIPFEDIGHADMEPAPFSLDLFRPHELSMPVFPPTGQTVP